MMRTIPAYVLLGLAPLAYAAAPASDGLPVTTQHRGTFNGVKVAYEASVAPTVLRDAGGAEELRLVSTSYLRTDKAKRPGTQRPVLFVFNGGPGASSSTLHLVALGPRRMAIAQDPAAAPDARLVDNGYSVLDVADLVFVDPAGTGFSRAATPAALAQAATSTGDADSIARLIVQWCREHGREAAPKFVLGESYGTIRAALVARQLAQTAPLEGVFLMGQALNIVETTQRAKNAVSYATNLPALAVIAAYHGRAEARGRTPQQIADAAYDWGMAEYLPALLRGGDLPAAERASLADRLARITGIPADYYLQHGLVISKLAFARELLRSEARILGTYDARYTGPAPAPGARAADPFAAAIAAQAPLFEEYLAAGLGIRSATGYRAQVELPDWKYEPTGGLGGPFNDYDYASALDAAFEANPRFRLTIGTGLYDLTTTVGPARYLLTQSRYPRERVRLRTYEGGHMAYTNETALAQFTADVRALVTGAEP